MLVTLGLLSTRVDYTLDIKITLRAQGKQKTLTILHIGVRRLHNYNGHISYKDNTGYTLRRVHGVHGVHRIRRVRRVHWLHTL